MRLRVMPVGDYSPKGGTRIGHWLLADAANAWWAEHVRRHRKIAPGPRCAQVDTLAAQRSTCSSEALIDRARGRLHNVTSNSLDPHLRHTNQHSEAFRSVPVCGRVRGPLAKSVRAGISLGGLASALQNIQQEAVAGRWRAVFRRICRGAAQTGAEADGLAGALRLALWPVGQCKSRKE